MPKEIATKTKKESNLNTTKEQERSELHRAIWQIANDLRGSVDGWDFKQYVLGILFYRFISENLTNYINADERRAGKKDFDYAVFGLVQISYFAQTARHTGKHGARTGYTFAYLASISFIWSKTTVGYLYSLAQSKVRKSLSRASSQHSRLNK
jgi:type I restriction-modification system DNA methylase subunit